MRVITLALLLRATLACDPWCSKYNCRPLCEAQNGCSPSCEDCGPKQGCPGEFVRPADLVCGEYVHVYGRDMLLVGTDMGEEKFAEAMTAGEEFVVGTAKDDDDSDGEPKRAMI